MRNHFYNQLFLPPTQLKNGPAYKTFKKDEKDYYVLESEWAYGNSQEGRDDEKDLMLLIILMIYGIKYKLNFMQPNPDLTQPQPFSHLSFMQMMYVCNISKYMPAR